MKKHFKIALTVLLAIVAMGAQAQTEVEMADGMRASGKIYVVLGIILIVLLGLVVYLFLMDKKVKKLEALVNARNGQTK